MLAAFVVCVYLFIFGVGVYIPLGELDRLTEVLTLVLADIHTLSQAKRDLVRTHSRHTGMGASS